MIREMNHIGLKVCDVDAAIRLYAEDLGGIVIRNSASLDGKSRFVYIQIGSMVIELITAQDESQQGYAHIAFLLDEMGLDAAYEKLSAEGYKFTVLPKVAGSGDGRLAFFLDDSGVLYELIQREEDIRKPAFSTPVVERLDHVMVNIAPEFAAKCDAFYQNEMGFAKKAEGRYAFGLDVLATQAAACCAPPIDHMAFLVKDISQTYVALLAKGYKIEIRPDGTLFMRGCGGEVLRFFAE